MPRVRFTENIQRHVPCPPCEVSGSNVRQVLEAYFASHPPARRYVLDEQGALRTHMALFVDGRPISDRIGLTDQVPPEATLDVMQALSGG